MDADTLENIAHKHIASSGLPVDKVTVNVTRRRKGKKTLQITFNRSSYKRPDIMRLHCFYVQDQASTVVRQICEKILVKHVLDMIDEHMGEYFGAYWQQYSTHYKVPSTGYYSVSSLGSWNSHDALTAAK